MAEQGITGQATLGIWYNAETDAVHLSIPGHGLSTVNSSAASKRGHPHLFNKLPRFCGSRASRTR
jgi:hypothetical protein